MKTDKSRHIFAIMPLLFFSGTLKQRNCNQILGHEIAFAHVQSPLCCIKKSIKKQFEKNKELLNFNNTINEVPATLHISYI